MTEMPCLWSLLPYHLFSWLWPYSKGCKVTAWYSHLECQLVLCSQHRKNVTIKVLETSFKKMWISSLSYLKKIIRTDHTRPSFPDRNNQPDLRSGCPHNMGMCPSVWHVPTTFMVFCTKPDSLVHFTHLHYLPGFYKAFECTTLAQSCFFFIFLYIKSIFVCFFFISPLQFTSRYHNSVHCCIIYNDKNWKYSKYPIEKWIIKQWSSHTM